MPRIFNEKTTDRVLASADERSSAVIARTALRRVMTESSSLYTKPYLVDWVQGKIDCFKDNLRAQIALKKGRLNRDIHFPELYAKMLREELEYIELCIEYNDKVKSTTDEEGFIVEDEAVVDPNPKHSEPPRKLNHNEGWVDGKIVNHNDKPKIIGKVDLDKE